MYTPTEWSLSYSLGDTNVCLLTFIATCQANEYALCPVYMLKQKGAHNGKFQEIPLHSGDRRPRSWHRGWGSSYMLTTFTVSPIGKKISQSHFPVQCPTTDNPEKKYWFHSRGPLGSKTSSIAIISQDVANERTFTRYLQYLLNKSFMRKYTYFSVHN